MGKVTNGGSGSTFIQQSTLEKLKCTKCGRYLSVLPIHRSPNGAANCGRCPLDNTLDFTRDDLYESAIEFQKFPCTNRESGCLETLFPVSLADHENKCHYMKHDCPTKVYNNCTWRGTLADILDHFNKEHPTFVLNDCKFEMDFVNNHVETYLMPFCEDLYVVTRQGDAAQKIFGVTVEYLGSNTDADDYMYELTMESGNKACKYSLEQRVGECIELKGQIVREMLNDPITIVAHVSIKEATVPITNDTEENDTEDRELDHEGLRDVECPVCMEHMLPPIFQCETGHSICKDCKENQSQGQSICPTCQGPFKETRNFAMERIIMKMTYPCKYEGCKFKTKAKDIKQHQASCLFGPFPCPLKDYENCSEIFRVSDLFNHIKSSHYESLYELDLISVPFDESIQADMDDDLSEGYILKHGQLLFKICFMYKFEEKKFFWSVQFVGPPEEGAKYNFELDVIDNNGRNLRLYLKAPCAPLLDQSETFQRAENYVYLHYDQISRFIKNQLTYRILITKKL